jgi:hypothetical protein
MKEKRLGKEENMEVWVVILQGRGARGSKDERQKGKSDESQET